MRRLFSVSVRSVLLALLVGCALGRVGNGQSASCDTGFALDTQLGQQGLGQLVICDAQSGAWRRRQDKQGQAPDHRDVLGGLGWQHKLFLPSYEKPAVAAPSVTSSLYIAVEEGEDLRARLLVRHADLLVDLQTASDSSWAIAQEECLWAERMKWAVALWDRAGRTERTIAMCEPDLGDGESLDHALLPLFHDAYLAPACPIDAHRATTEPEPAT